MVRAELEVEQSSITKPNDLVGGLCGRPRLVGCG